jgi:hypothetical protein
MFITPLLAFVLGLKAGTVSGPELHVPLGLPLGGLGQLIDTPVPPALTVSELLAHVGMPPGGAGVAPGVTNVMLAHSCSLVAVDAAKKFAPRPVGLDGQAVQLPAEAVHGRSHTSLACGATGLVVGVPGVPLFDHTRVNTMPRFDVLDAS